MRKGELFIKKHSQDIFWRSDGKTLQNPGISWDMEHMPRSIC
jgi:hypothetical protein